MSDPKGIREALEDSARGLVRDLAGKLDLEGVKSALADIEAAAEGAETSIDVTSAVPLTDIERETLERTLRRQAGRDVAIHYRVSPEILGGLIVRVGDRYVDGSVAARLGQLRFKLVGTR